MTYDDRPGPQSWPSGQQHGRKGQPGQEPGYDGGWQPPEWRYGQQTGDARDAQRRDAPGQYQPQQGPWNAASGARYSPSFSPSQPPHMPPRQPPQRGKSWPSRHKALTGCLAFVALIIIIIIVAANSGGSPSSPGSGTTVGLTTTASATAAKVPSQHVTQAAAAVQKSHPKKTTQTTPATSQAPAPPAPAQTPPAAVVAPPVSAAPPSCHPLTNGGNCYKPGEYCRNSDHGVSGVAGDGEAISCENNDGWRWEPS